MMYTDSRGGGTDVVTRLMSLAQVPCCIRAELVTPVIDERVNVINLNL